MRDSSSSSIFWLTCTTIKHPNWSSISHIVATSQQKGSAFHSQNLLGAPCVFACSPGISVRSLQVSLLPCWCHYNSTFFLLRSDLIITFYQCSDLWCFLLPLLLFSSSQWIKLPVSPINHRFTCYTGLQKKIRTTKTTGVRVNICPSRDNTEFTRSQIKTLSEIVTFCWI